MSSRVLFVLARSCYFFRRPISSFSFNCELLLPLLMAIDGFLPCSAEWRAFACSVLGSMRRCGLDEALDP